MKTRKVRRLEAQLDTVRATSRRFEKHTIDANNDLRKANEKLAQARVARPAIAAEIRRLRKKADKLTIKDGADVEAAALLRAKAEALNVAFNALSNDWFGAIGSSLLRAIEG